MNDLNAQRALIFRITHIENVPWILDHGLHCRNSGAFDPGYHDIGNPDLIEMRANRMVPIEPGGTLSDYIPFYFTPHTPMLLNIKTGYQGMRETPMAEIVILVSSLPKVEETGARYVFTDRHAYLHAAKFFADRARLTDLDWTIIQRRDFRRDPNDPGKIERYQAEALVFRHLPTKGLLGLACQSPAGETRLRAVLEKRNLALRTVVRPRWFF